MNYLIKINKSEFESLEQKKILENVQKTSEIEELQLKVKNEIQNTINSMKAYEKFDRTGKVDFALENSGE